MYKKKLMATVLYIMTVAALVGCSPSTSGTKKEKEHDIKIEMPETTEDIDDSNETMTENNTETSETGESLSKDSADVQADNAEDNKDKFGSINGIPFVIGSNVFNGTFGADGFVVNSEEDGNYNFSPYTSEKYPGVSVFLYHKNLDESNCTDKEIMEDGFYGYDVDCVSAKTDARPNMTWNGITWGASKEDIEKIYGKPDDVYNTDMYEKYCYNISNNGLIEFSVFNDAQKNKGLQKVTLYVFPENQE